MHKWRLRSKKFLKIFTWALFFVSNNAVWMWGQWIDKAKSTKETMYVWTSNEKGDCTPIHVKLAQLPDVKQQAASCIIQIIVFTKNDLNNK